MNWNEKQVYGNSDAVRVGIDTLAEETTKGGVFISLTLDVRHATLEQGNIPIAVRVTFQRQRAYFRSGTKVKDLAEYDRLLRMRRNNEPKNSLIKMFEDIVHSVEDIEKQGAFSLNALQERHSKRSTTLKITLFDYWDSVGKSKVAQKTKEQYRQALSKFRQFRDRDMPIKAVTANVIRDWDKYMAEQEHSADTRSIYLRALRAVLNQAKEEDIIQTVPKIAIPKGRRREENYLHVEDIIKLRDFVPPADWDENKREVVQRAVDYWLLLYCLNGCNSIDAAKLRWNKDYKNALPELTFQRSKTTRDGLDSMPIIRVPIIPELERLIDKYASDYQDGRLVFPFIIGNAESEKQINSRVHDFNDQIRTSIIYACQELGIKEITAQYARNSFITTLTHHGISDVYIDRAVGHTTGNRLLRGYQGQFSDRQRLKFNNLLFINPDYDE